MSSKVAIFSSFRSAEIGWRRLALAELAFIAEIAALLHGETPLKFIAIAAFAEFAFCGNKAVARSLVMGFEAGFLC